MRAILQTAYGPPDLLRLTDVEPPKLRDDGVMVKVITATVHKGDWHLLTGTPYLLRLAGFGMFKPNNPIPGMAVAGQVEAVGPAVTAFRPGDEVFGEIKAGGFAEYVCAGEAELAHKPAGVSFEAAASLPVSATTALQGLRDAGRLQPGQSVLINGAAGGVGTFAVQIAKQLGAEVTAVCSAGNVAAVVALGADHVIDYGQEDFTAGDRRYDVILDLVGNHAVGACRRVLMPQGRFVSAAGGAQHEWTGPLFPLMCGMASNLFSKQPFVPLVARPGRADLEIVAGYVEAGAVTPVIERRYALADVPEALRVQGLGHAVGKSLITIG